MDIENNHKEPTNNKKPSEEIWDADLKPKTNEELNEKRPARKNRKQATEEQLANPLHGVKLKQILESLVENYGWDYLAEHINIRCFKFNPTMKSSLGFLRKNHLGSGSS